MFNFGRVDILDSFDSLCKQKSRFYPIWVHGTYEEEALEVIEALADHYGIKIQTGGFVGEADDEEDDMHDDPGDIRIDHD